MNLTPEKIKEIQEEEKKNLKPTPKEVTIEELKAELDELDGLFSTNRSIAQALHLKYSIFLR